MPAHGRALGEHEPQQIFLAHALRQADISSGTAQLVAMVFQVRRIAWPRAGSGSRCPAVEHSGKIRLSPSALGLAWSRAILSARAIAADSGIGMSWPALLLPMVKISIS